MTYVDGNAVLGAMSLVMGTDVSRAAMECGGCGRNHMIAEAHVYLRCPGMVIRCPSCAGTEVILVEIGNQLQMNVRNVALIRLNGMPVE